MTSKAKEIRNASYPFNGDTTRKKYTVGALLHTSKHICKNYPEMFNFVLRVITIGKCVGILRHIFRNQRLQGIVQTMQLIFGLGYKNPPIPKLFKAVG